MVVIILERAPARLRGELTRWLLEPATGVYLGHINARVRDRLWDRCCREIMEGGILQAWNTDNEQHFQMRTYGVTSRRVVEFEGLQLVEIFNPPISQNSPICLQIEPEIDESE